MGLVFELSTDVFESEVEVFDFVILVADMEIFDLLIELADNALFVAVTIFD